MDSIGLLSRETDHLTLHDATSLQTGVRLAVVTEFPPVFFVRVDSPLGHHFARSLLSVENFLLFARVRHVLLLFKQNKLLISLHPSAPLSELPFNKDTLDDIKIYTEVLAQ